jgi:8-amino-7-oxononanoate synthase
VKHFFKTIEANLNWPKASEMGILSIPIIEDWKERDFQAYIVPVKTRQHYNWWLVFHLQLSGISAFPIDYPTVPRGQSRIRMMFYAANAEEQVEKLATTIFDWATVMILIEENSDGAKGKMLKAAQRVYALMAAQG